MTDEIGLDGRRALDALMHLAERAGPAELTELVRRAAASMGIRDATIFLTDLQQDVLIAVSDAKTHEQRRYAIDDSLPGWAYRSTSIRVSECEGQGLLVWLPLHDGVERIGVLRLECGALDAPTLRFGRSLAALLTLIVLTKNARSDSFERLQRIQPMSLAAEMVWAFLPPRTLKAPYTTSCAVLEPAYDVGGDAFDHTLIDGVLHATILDAMGHDLLAGLISSVAMAGCRNSRRADADLSELTKLVDRTIADTFPDRYCTAVFARIELRSGELTWTNCGHPAPLLIRDQRLMPDALERPTMPPLGLGELSGGDGPPVHSHRLEPGDRILLYTDGVTDARSASGQRFGLDNFADFLIRATAAGEPAYEALRRLIHAILAHHDQRLTDDASIVLLEWQPSHEHPAATPVL
ncbi:serine/threonine-protein phosphatase [Actinomadura sp. ATCC 31491]|uniref:Serine/threonine-protein phosphatase n=1 Tax=Actinomadura luzonensis TaxID=2805427 RepID=A0ABT0G0M9_9ACTN|nr:PP2C family protein-serine/threonine phosphatase [Actinomadura luzonensis]MCK2218162.1 serine/threonine-protein phosphatase [Actinomadura luzonensis]